MTTTCLFPEQRAILRAKVATQSLDKALVTLERSPAPHVALRLVTYLFLLLMECAGVVLHLWSTARRAVLIAIAATSSMDQVPVILEFLREPHVSRSPVTRLRLQVTERLAIVRLLWLQDLPVNPLATTVTCCSDIVPVQEESLLLQAVMLTLAAWLKLQLMED